MKHVETELEQIELSIEQAKTSIEIKEAFIRLLDNPDFNKVITEGYFEKEACRLVLMKADPGMATEEHQKQVIKSIDSIGSLRQYFQTIMHFGNMAEKAIRDDEETRDELLAEAG